MQQGAVQEAAVDGIADPAPVTDPAPLSRVASLSPSRAADFPAPRSRVASLSPSRAADFKSCPLLFRFRTIDHLPEPPSAAAARGTLVHSVLEQLFDLPAGDRTLAASHELLEPSWTAMTAREPALTALFDPPAAETPIAVEIASELHLDQVPRSCEEELAAFMAAARELLATYFRLEDPTRLEPAAREERVQVETDSGLLLRGIIDRIDIAPSGEIRIVDYKTGKSPREAFESKALFQMKFYALVIWKTRGVVPHALRLMYLSDGDTLTYRPDAQELERFERTLSAIGTAIAKAVETQDFRPHPSRLCDWCAYHAVCPAFGGTPPPFPVDVTPTEPELANPVSPSSPAQVSPPALPVVRVEL